MFLWMPTSERLVLTAAAMPVEVLAEKDLLSVSTLETLVDLEVVSDEEKTP